MLEAEYKSLVEQLHRRTERGEVNWLETSDEKVFLVNFQGYSLALRNTQEGYLFTVRDSRGKTIDDFYVTPMMPIYSKSAEMFASARRLARKVDKALEAILGEVSGGERVGEASNIISDETSDDDVPF